VISIAAFDDGTAEERAVAIGLALEMLGFS
jgi:hypothetical protein